MWPQKDPSPKACNLPSRIQRLASAAGEPKPLPVDAQSENVPAGRRANFNSSQRESGVAWNHGRPQSAALVVSEELYAVGGDRDGKARRSDRRRASVVADRR